MKRGASVLVKPEGLPLAKVMGDVEEPRSFSHDDIIVASPLTRRTKMRMTHTSKAKVLLLILLVVCISAASSIALAYQTEILSLTVGTLNRFTLAKPTTTQQDGSHTSGHSVPANPNERAVQAHDFIHVDKRRFKDSAGRPFFMQGEHRGGFHDVYSTPD